MESTDKITGKVAVVGSGNQGLSKAAMSALMVPMLVSALSPSPYMDMMPRFRSRGRPPIRFFSCPMCGAQRKTVYWNGERYVCSQCEKGEQT